MNYRVCFAAYLRRQGRKPVTVKFYTGSLQMYLHYCAQHRKRGNIPALMNPLLLEKYRDYLIVEKSYASSTVNRNLCGLSAFARFLMERGMLSYNPLDLVARAGKCSMSSIERRAAWQDIQLLRAKLHQDVMNVRDRAIIELLYTGLTVKELCSLLWDHSDVCPQTIKVGKRQVSLHAEARLAWQHYMILRPILRGPFLLVGNRQDASFDPGTVYSMVSNLARRHGVKVGMRMLRLAKFAGEIYGFAADAMAAQAA